MMHENPKNQIMLALKIAEYLEIKKPILKDDHSLELKIKKDEAISKLEECNDR